MRAPTSDAALYAWWRAALAGGRPPVHEGEPECGWFKTRMVRGGPWVPARIWCERDIDPETGELATPEALRCEVGGQHRDPSRAWLTLANRPISEAEFHILSAAAVADPRMAATLAVVDLTSSPTRP